MIRVILVEDDKDLRRHLATVIGSSEGLELVASFERAEDLVDSIGIQQPDVVVMDINLPQMSGIDAVSKLKLLYPKVQFLMCTVYDHDDAIFDSLCSGATGYILKMNPSAEILSAIKEIHAGGSPMSSSIARRVVSVFNKPRKTTEEIDHLSKREKEILDLLAKGFRYKEIAAQLFLSVETVRTHIRNIYEKLQVQSRTEALNKVFGRG